MNLSALITHGGPVMPLILLCAGVGLLLAFERIFAWAHWTWRERALRAAPDAITLQGALQDMGRNAMATPLENLLLQALPLRQRPPGEAAAALRALLLRELPAVERRISTIGWIGTVLPMLGLLGTVSGMVTTFEDLAQTTSRQVLSGGLSEALLTTQVGLVGALPLLAAHHLLGRLKARWLNNLERALVLLLPHAALGGDAPPRPATSTGMGGDSGAELEDDMEDMLP